MLVGREAETAAIVRLLADARRGRGGVLVLHGVAGVGKTAMLDHAAAYAGTQAVPVVRAAAHGRTGTLVWARVVRDAGGSEADAASLLEPLSPLELDAVCARLVSAGPKLVLVDDVDHAGPSATHVLTVLAHRAVGSTTTVVVTSMAPLGVGREVRLSPLEQNDIRELAGDADDDVVRAIWAASRGLPGVAVELLDRFAGIATDVDPVAALALDGPDDNVFLDVDPARVHLLELALARGDDATRPERRTAVRAQLLAALAHELMGDASTTPRRRQLIETALTLATESGDERALARVLDARLHALWGPDTSEDRLATADDIVALARASGDMELERRGHFWRFITLVEAARIGEAESALAAYARHGGDDSRSRLTVLSRHGMLAVLRGRFAQAREVVTELEQLGHPGAFADRRRLMDSLLGSIAMDCGPLDALEEYVEVFFSLARRFPGHHYDASAARLLAVLGRRDEALAELDRVLPTLVSGSGPRWLGAVSEAATAAWLLGHREAADALYTALAPFAGRLVVLGGANTTNGPVDRHLGAMALVTGRHTSAIEHLERAAELERRAGALPGLAHTSALLARALLARGAAGDQEQSAEALEHARSIARRLGMAPLLDSLEPPVTEWSLRRDGPDWLLVAGAEAARLRDVRGLHHLAVLLASPHRDVSALTLAGDGRIPPASTSRDSLIDPEAARAYRRRLDQLEEEADAADRRGDDAVARDVDRERSALLAELRRATGLGGRPREFGSDAERARVSVTKALRKAVGRIEEQAPMCAAHLRSSLRTGQDCRYAPAPGGPVRWVT